jgi:hypothetical protein
MAIETDVIEVITITIAGVVEAEVIDTIIVEV